MATEQIRQISRRPLGATGLLVPELCVGTNALGGVARLYGYDVDGTRAVATLRAALSSQMDFIDTSNGYAAGESELRIGEALRELGGLPDGAVLATKIDPDPTTKDFSGERVRRSLVESMERLGLDHLQLVYLHDPERITFEEALAPGGPVEVLLSLRDEGVIDHVGVAGGPVALMQRYIGTGAFSVVLTHSRYTLLDRSAAPLLDDASQRGIGVVNAAPYGGGMLSKGPASQPRYAYGQAAAQDERLRAVVKEMDAACREYGVPLAAAALQHSVRDHRITSTVVGISTPERVEQTIASLQCRIPDTLWARLDELTPPAAGWLH